jgi:hypothetical protein
MPSRESSAEQESPLPALARCNIMSETLDSIDGHDIASIEVSERCARSYPCKHGIDVREHRMSVILPGLPDNCVILGDFKDRRSQAFQCTGWCYNCQAPSGTILP